MVGQILRRKSYALLDGSSEQFAGETAKILGVLFELVPFRARESRDFAVALEPNHIYLVPEKAQYKITFPRVTGYQQSGQFRVKVDWRQAAQVALDPVEFS